MTKKKTASKKTAAKKTAAKKPAAKKPAAKKPASKKKTASAKKPASKKTASKTPKLLSGGNPQIAKGDGDAPVQAFIDAMPGWKQGVGRELDALVRKVLPKANRAVKWNTPFYGVDGHGWIMGFHCVTKYVKVTFFNGAALDPQPPESSKMAKVRYVHIHEGEAIDTKQFTKWLRQAAKVDGWFP